jgi:hypothetical protein
MKKSKVSRLLRDVENVGHVFLLTLRSGETAHGFVCFGSGRTPHHFQDCASFFGRRIPEESILRAVEVFED